MKEKTCSGCECRYPATPKYFWRSQRERDGLRNRCKQCCQETLAYIRTRGSRKGPRVSA